MFIHHCQQHRWLMFWSCPNLHRFWQKHFLRWFQKFCSLTPCLDSERSLSSMSAEQQRVLHLCVYTPEAFRYSVERRSPACWKFRVRYTRQWEWICCWWRAPENPSDMLAVSSPYIAIVSTPTEELLTTSIQSNVIAFIFLSTFTLEITSPSLLKITVEKCNVT